jgi:hypothetical protein
MLPGRLGTRAVEALQAYLTDYIQRRNAVSRTD